MVDVHQVEQSTVQVQGHLLVQIQRKLMYSYSVSGSILHIAIATCIKLVRTNIFSLLSYLGFHPGSSVVKHLITNPMVGGSILGLWSYGST